MIDTKAKRAAALGYGLSFLLVLPPADGTISNGDAGHALNAYQFDLSNASLTEGLIFVREALVPPIAFDELMVAPIALVEALVLPTFSDGLVAPVAVTVESLEPAVNVGDEELG